MIHLPSRQGLAALAEAANTFAPSAALGFSRSLDNGRVSVLYSWSQGMGAHVVDAVDVMEALLPGTDGVGHADDGSIVANPLRAIEWHLHFLGVKRVLSARVPQFDPPARFWVGSSDPDRPTNDRIAAFEALAASSAAILSAPVSPAEADERLRRLELAAGLLPELLRVLDIREVFDRLSAVSQQALPHDSLTMALANEDLTELTLYAQTAHGLEESRVFPQPYPPAFIRAWDFDILDDRTTHALERNRPGLGPGTRSSLRLPIRFDDRVIAGIGFNSLQPATFTSLDVAVARRLADHVAVALSHHALAEQLAEEARRGEELRTRTTKLELLDELLAALTDAGDVREVFGRLSSIAGKVLAHDAAALMVRLPDGRRARLYASSGFPGELPEIMEIPEELLQNPDWEHDIFDDLSLLTRERYARLARMGFRSLLRVPIRHEGRFAGALIFLSNVLSAFRHGDILVARRMADRLAATLSRDREIEASRRADEATARAARLEARVRALTEELDSRTGYRRVVGESAQWRQVLTQAAQVAATDTTVLLLGESGTGKEVVARFLHRGSPRKGGPFVALNCAALPEHLLEAELFGYERGAFTGATQSKPGQLEQAAGGTLFLDEVAEMSPSAQAKFLRVLQEREFQRLGGTRVLRTDARVVAATNRDLHRAIANGQFREDLFYRLNVFAIQLPPLRDRRDDILPLSQAFLAEIGQGLGRPPAGISRDARQRLVEYRWPGNVRELRNILERAAILCDGGLITAEHLALAPSPDPAISSSHAVAPAARAFATAAGPAAPASPSSANDLQLMERAMIEQALQAARFNKSKAAKALGLTRHQLYIRMRKHGLE
ncbi:MAG TPA: sigma 54-interacting transcriptional regulator [Vicinamibacterales bacterium]|nr:sigma 54-interacting transcriptional regulator [Vicinamibacterales bacterium]